MAHRGGFWEDDDEGQAPRVRQGEPENRPRRDRGGRRGVQAGRGLQRNDLHEELAFGGEGARGRGRGRGQGGGRGGGRGGRGGGRGGLRNMNFGNLMELANREPGDIVLTLSHPNSGFRDALFQSINSPVLVRALLRVLAKASTTTALPQYLLGIFTMIKEASFFDTAVVYFMDLQADMLELSPRRHEEIQQSIKDIIVLFRELSAQMPNSITQFLGVHAVLQTLINSLREHTDLIDDEIMTGFTELTEQKEALYRRFQRRNVPQGRRDETRFEGEEPPEDFRDIEIFPQTADLQIEDGPYLRKNKVKGEYVDLNHYLDVQFRLLREDFVGPLRDGIAGYIEAVQERGKTKAKLHEVRIYPNVRIIAPICGDMGLCHVLQFDISRMGKVRWQSSKRLIYGSLVCLSPDNFRTFYFATVSNREPKDLEKGLIQVRFEHNNVRGLMAGTYTMAETTAYFESYRHVLSGLKNTRAGDMPFERYIIKCKSDVDPPSYIQRRGDTLFDLRPLVDDDVILHSDSRLERAGEVLEARQRYDFSAASEPARAVTVLDRATWPPADLLHLDDSQYRAIHTALTKELAIIQGPPGTGKTYIGLKIVKALLHNRKTWSFHPNTGEEDLRPMLIVCYTNHALDQFLEGIVKFFKGDVLRVGGRSSSDILKDYNLHNFRQRFRHAQKITPAVFQGRREAKEEMERVRKQIDTSACKIQVAHANLLHEDFLQHVMGHWYDLLTQQFQDILYTYADARTALGRRFSVIVEWLGLGNLAPIVEVEAALAPEVQNVPFPQQGGGEEELIDAEDELDAIQAQRQIMDEYEDAIENEVDDLVEQIFNDDMTRRERDKVRLQLEMTRVQNKAVALDVLDFDKKPIGTVEGEWQVQKKQKKKMKRNIQRQLASGNIMSEAEARQVHDLWRMDIEEKWRLYRMWVNSYCRLLMDEIQEKETEYEVASQRYREALMQEDRQIMRQATIIGMTTTGAAKYQAVLQDIQPRIIVVEEAAEVLEAHIVTTLNRGCEHLILIGDHKQLKPNPTVYKLATKYNLEISLFERLINNGIRCDCLELQHRMRPEIAELMKPIYATLQNHEDVNSYEDIKGVVGNLFFINHSVEEQHDDDLRSHSNDHEAEYIAGLCNFLLLQGYKPSQITVLTLYSGQLFRLKKLMPKSKYEGVRLTVVDNYQGEENDIILLSLVRSNPDGHAGFLKIDNRVCVALSRAKKGFYVIGNFDMLAESSKLWREITIQMKRRKLLGESLQLSCQNHPEDGGLLVTVPADFDRAPEGGCSKKCQARLPCGHSCEMFCHVQDQDHKDYKCKKPCAKQICPNNHRCRRRCFEKCGECQVPTMKRLRRCGHDQEVPCSMNADQFQCREKCTSMLSCGHICQALCGQAHTSSCRERIQHTWPCGHKGTIFCGDRNKAKCGEKCQEILECGHLCGGTCGSCFQGRLHMSCQNKCNRILVCGHECLNNCNNCPPCTRICQNRCKHSKCTKQCGEECVPCKEICTWQCEHFQCNMLCSEPCDRQRCNAPCMKRLDCGHICIGLCGEPCPQLCRRCDKETVTTIFFGDEDEPNARFVLMEDCRHIVEYKAMDKYMDEDTSGDGAIQLKTCPICRTPIRKSARYGTIINRSLQDIENVKKIMIGNDAKIEQLKREIERSVVELAINDRLKMMKRFLNLTQVPPERTLVAIENQVSLLKSVANLEEECDKLKSVGYIEERRKSVSYLASFREWILEERTIMTEQEVADAKFEVSRIECHIHLLLHQQTAQDRRIQLDADIRREVQASERICSDGKRFTDDHRTTVKSCLKKLKTLVPLTAIGVTEEERLMIVNAIGLNKGHWFKCPNGHPYAIGDCGGATMESTCPECGARIGGTQHRVRDDNAFAPEMDNAEAPAWSNVVNLHNYELDF